LARRDTSTPAANGGGAESGWSDERLVRECLGGNDQAWSALIDKYRNLIFSIPRRYGASPQDAEDIFQAVCLDLFAELPKLRKKTALRSWLISITAHRAFHWKRKLRQQGDHQRLDGAESEDGQEEVAFDLPMQTDAIEELEREQMVLDALADLPPRCREMIRMLFYVDPPVPYREVARRLGLATGSIGFIRGRCLDRLQKALQRMGL
jgi:RNA polymerase sigma factor (sigma-70 family)